MAIKDKLTRFLPGRQEKVIYSRMNSMLTEIENNVDSEIGQIANDRGYLNSKSLGSDIDLNNFFIQGKYYSSTCLNRPNSDAFIIDISGITSASSAITQKATCYYGAGNVNFGKTYERTYYQASGGWTAWTEIALTERTVSVKAVPVGINKIFSIIEPGLYRIFEGRTQFIDYPDILYNQGLSYGILEVTTSGYTTYKITATDGAITKVMSINGFRKGSDVIVWDIPRLVSAIAAPGITITEQLSYMYKNIMYIDITVKKTDNTNFAAGQQFSLATFSTLPTISTPRNIPFSGWFGTGGNVLSGGGVATLFTDKVLYAIPTISCPYLRLSGSFILYK